MLVVFGMTLFAVALAGLRRLRGSVLVAAVQGPSMLPTYRDGDRLLARRRGRALPRAGQVVVFRNPKPIGVPGSSDGALLIKRVIAIPGDPAPAGVAGSVVPAAHLAVVGDNAAQSLDSRQLGFIPVDHVIATVVRKLDR